MARKGLIISWQRKLDAVREAKAAGKKAPHAIRVYNRCSLCHRRHGYIRFFGVCRICFRELASNGEIPGVTKSSW